MVTCWIDTETYCEGDLGALGSYLYVKHPTFELLTVQWARDDGPAHLWDLTTDRDMPTEFKELYYDPDVLLNAWNANFDRNVLNEAIFETPISRWRDSMVKALLHGLPGKLENAGRALGLTEEQAKLVEGRKLVTRFCMPSPANHKVRRYTRHTHPEEWARFCEYGLRDIDAMRLIDRLIPDLNSSPELAHWHLDQVINDRGFLADRDLAEAGASAADVEQAWLAQRMRELTDGQVEKPSQRQRLLDYLTEHGCPLPDLTKTTVAYAVQNERTPDDARELLQLRQQASKTSTAKYRALRDAIGTDDRFRGGIQFAGAARTRRASGRKFQAQNLPSRDLPPARQVELYIDALKLGIHKELFA